MNALWRALTRTRTMRSAAAEFGPPPGARYAADLATLTDAEVLLYGDRVVARAQARRAAARDQVVAELARLTRRPDVRHVVEVKR